MLSSCRRVIVEIDDVLGLVRVKLNNVLSRLRDLLNNIPWLSLKRVALTPLLSTVSLFIVLTNFFYEHVLRVSINLFHIL